MSDPEAKQRQLKRRMLEEQLRILDDEERHSTTTMSNTPVTASGSYPPQWAATITNPSSSRHSALSSSIYDASHSQQGSTSRNPHIPPRASSSSWADLSNQNRNQQYHPQPQSSSQSHRPSSVSRSNQQQRAHTQPEARSGHQQQQQQHDDGQYQKQNQNQHQSQPLPYSSGSTRHHSFRDLDSSSTGPSSSISPQFSSALPTPQNATFSTSQTVPLPSERQLHDWLRDCMGQVEGLDTDWRINGKRVDMYKLLASVIRSGGSTEVSSRGWWYMLAKLLNLADDLTPQTVKSSIAKQLQELFLQMLGGLEILWDKTKGTEEREAIPRTRENSNLSGSSTLPTPISATINPGIYSQHQSSALSRHASNSGTEVPSPQQEHHYVDPSKLTLPPKAAKLLSSQQSARGGESTNVRRQSAISTFNSNSAHSNTVNSANYNPRHSPSSFARPTSVASNGTQQSPNIPSQIPLHQPTPSHPPPHRLPDLLTSQNDGGSERTQTSLSSQSHIPPPAKSTSTDMLTSPSQQSSRTVQLRFANKSLGEYQVTNLSSFQELVTSHVLPLPPLEPDSNLQRMTWSSDPLIRYSKRCHELGHSVRKLKAGQASRQISPEELVFWAKLLVIMAGNPSVIPPPVDDRPPSNPPPTTMPNPTSSSITTAGPPGSFTNPVALVPPPSDPNTTAHNQGDQTSTSSQNGQAIGQSTASQSKKRPRKSGDDTAGSHTDTPTVPKKRGRNPGVPNRPKQRITITPAVPSQVESQPVPQSTQVSQNHNNGVPQAPQSQAAPLSQPPTDIVSGTQPTQIEQASAALAFIGAAERVPAKRGRPKGSKTVNRKSLPKQNQNGQESSQLNANIDPTILVPASQPELIPSYSQYDSLAQLSQPPTSFQDLFRSEHENEGVHPSLFAGLAEAGPPASAPASTLPFSTPSRPDQDSSKALETNSVSGGSNRKPLTAEQRADKSAKEKARRQRLKEIQGILAPLMKYKKPPIDPSTRIPLVPNLSPKRRIDLSSPDRASSAQIRAQDMGPTRIIGRTASALSNELSAGSASRVEKTKKYKKKQNVAHDDRATGQTSQAIAVNIDIMNIDPKFTQDDGYEPSPAQVQELARALVESIGPIPDAQVEGEEELHGANDADREGEADSEIPHSRIIQSKKKKRGRPRKEKKIVGASQSQQGSTVLSTPARKSILVVEVPSSKKTARVKFDEEIDGDELDPEAEIEVILNQREESPEYEPSPELEDDGEGEQEIEEIEDEEQDEVEGRRSKRKRDKTTTSKPVFEKIPGSSGRGGFSVVGAASSAAKARWDGIKRRSLDLSPSTSTRISTRETPQASPSISRSARERRTSSVVPIPDLQSRSGSAGRRSNSILGSIRREAQPDPSASRTTKTKSKSQRRVSSVVVNSEAESDDTQEQDEDEGEDELELEGDLEHEDDDVGFAIEIESPKIVRKRVEKKSNASSPVDRAKVVIPISRRRREELISRGHYNALRDDDSDDERSLPRRAHVSLRPMKLTVQRGSRIIRPSSPEPIPLRFMFRPGPALLEPFASILTENSLSNRVHEYPCRWKGCDSILASEELLKRHVENRQHAKQGKEVVSTERWSWNTRRTTERQVVKGKWFYRCLWKGCEQPCFTSEADLLQHLTARHISKVMKCPYEACELTSLNISHLSRHVMKQHDSPSDHPVPLANISIPLPPPSPPTELLPEIARANELTTQRALGSAHRSAFYNNKVKEKVASHCFAGPDPVIHVVHPPHMLEIVDDEDDVIDSTGKEKKRRVQVVVEIPLSKRRKLTEQEKRDRVLRMMNSIDTATVPNAQQHQQDNNNDNQEVQIQNHNVTVGGDNGSYSPSYAYELAPTPWIETDVLMIEDELVLGAPTPAPFPMPWNDQDDDDDEEDEQEANAELQEEEEEEDGDLFREFAEAVQAQAELEVEGPEDPESGRQNGTNEDQQEIDIDTPSRTQHSIIKPNMSTSVFFSPSISTPAIPAASNGVATPTPQRKGSISFPFPPQSRPSPILNNIAASTGVGTNSPLRFGFAERFVATEVPSTFDVQDEPTTATSTVVTSASSSKYTALEEAVQVTQESEEYQNGINTEDVIMDESNAIADDDVVRLNEVQVEMLS
ncbi:hypothetical protein V865_006017 [Kwoniella europaea PYCC6329]|uniref:ARID domain-containing protein n=1 Tax=Kwoniella europaea PYCC6329 TaxID=1423913 RepID=A0AAX4KN65_9TREE